jgi:hypothetical protein
VLNRHKTIYHLFLAESIGFEPMRPFLNDGLANRCLNHSANSPIWRSQGVTIPFFQRDRLMCVHEHFETKICAMFFCENSSCSLRGFVTSIERPSCHSVKRHCAFLVRTEGIEPNRQPPSILRQEIYSLPLGTARKNCNTLFRMCVLKCSPLCF